MSMLSRRLACRALFLLVFSAAGCSRLFTEPPRPLFRITAPTGIPTGLPRVAAQLVIDRPNAPAGLNTVRIAIAKTPVSLDYLADGDWTDDAPALVRSALIEGFEASGAFKGVGRDTFSLRADFSLDSELRHFEAIYDSPGGAPMVVVTLAVKLIRIPEHTVAAETVVTAREPARANATPQIVMAFNAALSKVVVHSVQWVATNPGLSAPRR